MRRALAAVLLAAALATGTCSVALVPTPAHAVQPDEMLADSALEARARALTAQLRCLVCQNESIDDSEASLARDLRVLVRERLEAGDSDRQVIDFLVARYGEFVLLKPRLTPQTVLLWATPPLALVAGLLLAWRVLRRRGARGDAAPLSAEEQADIDRLLASGEAASPMSDPDRGRPARDPAA